MQAGRSFEHIQGIDVKLLLIGIVSLSLWLDSAATQAPQAPAMRDASAQRIETYAAAEIDASGSLRITTSDGKTIVVPKDREQSAFRPPAISPDRTAVGAQADYPNCCTSYDIPLQLVVFSNGKVHWFKGVGLPIFHWHFADSGTRVAYGQEPVHFGCETHYELRDIQSERLIDSADVPQPCGQRNDPPETTIPKWVKELNAARQ